MQATREENERLELCEAEVHPDSPLSGMTIQEAGGEQHASDIVFVAVQTRGGELIIRPRGDRRFEQGDVIIVAGKASDLRQMRELASETVCA